LKEITMRRTILAAIAILVLCGAVPRAHHGGYEKDFDVDHPISVEGDLEAFLFVNPHVVLKIRTADSTVYTAIWESAFSVKRYGLTSATLRAGDHVIVSGAPSRNPALRELALLREVRRPRDGWKWGDVNVPTNFERALKRQ
jgi:hypothetical protein